MLKLIKAINMQKESGVTLTGIIVYVIAMAIVISIVATITSFFYTNIMGQRSSSDNMAEITKFHMYFLEEVKDRNAKITKIENSSIQFGTGNTFSFENNSIYYNRIKICSNVKLLQFTQETVNSHQIIKVLITIGDDMEYTKTTEYVLGS